MLKPSEYDIDCIGPDTVDTKVLRYLGGLLNATNGYNTPLFAFVWFTNLAHGDRTAPIFADATYANYIGNLDLENTILFFMSDHGARFGSFRETELGWYEDKLPNFWVYLPLNVRQQHPEWMINLHFNSKYVESFFVPYKNLTLHSVQTKVTILVFTDA